MQRWNGVVHISRSLAVLAVKLLYNRAPEVIILALFLTKTNLLCSTIIFIFFTKIKIITNKLKF